MNSLVSRFNLRSPNEIDLQVVLWIHPVDAVVRLGLPGREGSLQHGVEVLVQVPSPRIAGERESDHLSILFLLLETILDLTRNRSQVHYCISLTVSKYAESVVSHVVVAQVCSCSINQPIRGNLMLVKSLSGSAALLQMYLNCGTKIFFTQLTLMLPRMTGS